MPEGVGYRSSFRTFTPDSKGTRAQRKAAKTMKEFKHGTLHSGGSGKIVTDPEQAYAIAQSQARKAAKKR